MKSISIFLFVLMGSLFLSCSGDDDVIDSDVCNAILDKGKFRLSDEVIDFFPIDYLTTINDITLFNPTGDSIVLEYQGKVSSFVDRASERPCDDGVNAYNYMLEYLSIQFGNDEYDLSLRASLDLNFDLANLNQNDSIIVLSVLDYDTCYSENFRVSLIENMPFNYNAIMRVFDNSSCISGTNVLEPTNALDVFSAIALNGIIFKDVIININFNSISSSSTFRRMFYNNTYGLLGFEDSNEVLWAIRI